MFLLRVRVYLYHVTKLSDQSSFTVLYICSKYEVLF